jgi:hypothetical protein
MGKVNEFKKGKAIVVIEQDGSRIVADYIYSYIYGGTPFINGTPYLDDELIYCSGFLNSKCFKLFSRLKRVVKGRQDVVCLR